MTTQRKLRTSGRYGTDLSGCFHGKRLVRALVVVEADPVAGGTCRVLTAWRVPAGLPSSARQTAWSGKAASEMTSASAESLF